MGEQLILAFAIYAAIINLAAFLLCGADKQFAKKAKRRVPEKTLFTIAALGGSVGMICSMYLFRHKTKHLSFTLGMPMILLLQFVLLYIIAC